MKGIPKERSNDLCPICSKKLLRTNWGKVDFTNPKSDDLWRYCCTSKVDTSFGMRLCYFNTPVVQLPIGYKGKINWSEIKSLTDNIHPVIKNAIDKAIKKNKFVN